MSVRRSTLLAVVAACAAVPATASAATVTVPAKCYIDQGKEGTIPVPFTVSGLAPGQAATATLAAPGITGTPAAIGPADAAGNAAGTGTWTSALGSKPTGDIPGTLTVSDPATGAPLASTAVTFGTAGVKIGTGKLTRPSKKVLWKVSGLSAVTGQTTYYAYYFKAKEAAKGKLKVIGKTKLGTGKGACGYLKTNKRLAPFSTPGAYVVVVETSKTFDPNALGIAGAIVIKKVKR